MKECSPLHLAQLCQSDYQNKWGKVPEPLSVGTDDVSLVYHPGIELVAVCRGTEHARLGGSWLREWIYNLTFRPVATSVFPPVHRGFVRNIDGLLLGFRESESLKEWTHSGGRFVITGHSRGGAIAYLLAFAIARTLHFHPDLVVTFGSPRVGGRSWRVEYEDLGIPTHRYITRNDPIPHLPPFIYFRHVGEKKVVPFGERQAGHSMRNYIKGLI